MKTHPLKFLTLFWFAALPLFSATDGTKPAEPTFHQKVYYFEHQLLPEWTHQTKGEFFSDLSKGKLDRITEAATDIVGKDFAQKLSVRTLPGSSRVLIKFEEPGEPPLCFFALVEKRGDAFRYFTLERTEDIFEDGTRSVFGEWDGQGAHMNLGTRKYSDEEHFLADIPKT